MSCCKFQGYNFLVFLAFQFRQWGSGYIYFFLITFCNLSIFNTFFSLKFGAKLLYLLSPKDLNVIVFWALLLSGSVIVLEITLCVLLRAITSPLVCSSTSSSKKQLLKMSRNCFLNLIPIWHMTGLCADCWSPQYYCFVRFSYLCGLSIAQSVKQQSNYKHVFSLANCKIHVLYGAQYKIVNFVLHFCCFCF